MVSNYRRLCAKPSKIPLAAAIDKRRDEQVRVLLFDLTASY